MKIKTTLLLILYFFVYSTLIHAEVPADWKQVTHGGTSFNIPGDWVQIKERKSEGRWGLKDDEKHEAIIFSVVLERRPERIFKSAKKDGMEVKELGRVTLGALSGDQYSISGKTDEVGEVVMRVIVLDGLLPDGDRITYSTSIVNLPPDDLLPIAEQVMASIQPTEELVATLTGYSRHELFDGLVSVEVRNNWEMSDYSDNVSWEPPLFSLYGADLIEFAKGYHLTGEKGLLSKLENPSIEKTEFWGIPGWKITGTGVAVSYRDGMRNDPIPATTVVYLSNICLEKGDRFGYVITASDEQLTTHKEELDKLLSSIELTLPETAVSCDELQAYESKRGVQIKVPTSWRKNQDEIYHLSWYDRDLITGANISLYISHGVAEKHPLIGEGYAPVDTIETISIDGYPATHYRKSVTGSNKVTSIHDYYVLDTRMSYKAKNQISNTSFIYFKFASSPAEAAEPDIEMQHSVLSTVVFGEGWESETPVVREEKIDNQSFVTDKDEPVMPTATATTTMESEAATSEQTVLEDARKDDIPVENTAKEEELPIEETVDKQDVNDHQNADESEPVEEKAVSDAAPDEMPSETGDISDDADEKRHSYEQAKALRDAGAELQQKGDLQGAVQKYRESLTLYPDDRLEKHVRRIEELLKGKE